MGIKWINRPDINKYSVLPAAQEYGISPEIAEILLKRNITDIKGFLDLDNAKLLPPQLLPDMIPAVNLILDALRTNTKIAVVNDYDVDGITSGIIMDEVLKLFGGNSKIYTPDRNKDGYGMSVRIVDLLYEDGCRFIITTDNGIAAMDAIKHAKELGIKVVITDHHEVPKDTEGNEILPPADAIIDQKLAASTYPEREICGAMIAYKVAIVLINSCFKPDAEVIKAINRFAEFAAMGTICDVMPLTGENRVIVHRGLEKLKSSSIVGIRQLLQGLNAKNMSVTTINFSVGPCLNSVSRMTGNVDLAIKLLTERDHLKAKELADKIIKINEKRKEYTGAAEKDIFPQCEAHKDDKVLILYTEGALPSLMGLVASRIVEKYNKPVICLTDDVDGQYKGSGRSIEGYNMFDSLNKFRDRFVKFGGHAEAIGITINGDDLEEIRRIINEDADIEVRDKEKYIDLYMNISDVKMEFVKALEKLGPFGKGNEEPNFVSDSFCLTKLERIGKDDRYLRLTGLDNEKRVSLVYFDSADGFDEAVKGKYGKQVLNDLYRGTKSIRFPIMYYPTVNIWNGKESISFQMKDFKI